MTTQRTARLWARLLTEALGYRRFAAASGDIGSGVTRFLALAHPELVVGIHLTYLSYRATDFDGSDLLEAEKQYLSSIEEWARNEGAYLHLQSTKPQTLSYGWNDSPVGLAAWMVQKFRTWSDCDGDGESRFSKDDLLTNIMIYWVTETINSSTRIYYENTKNSANPSTSQMSRHIEGPAAMAISKEISHPPREWAERSVRVERWTEMPRGGHFAAMEEPEALVEDIRAFSRPLR